MKTALIGLLILGSLSSYAEISYNENNASMAIVMINAQSEEKCKTELLAAEKLIKSRNKVLIKKFECRENLENGNNQHGYIAALHFHKYL